MKRDGRRSGVSFLRLLIFVLCFLSWSEAVFCLVQLLASAWCSEAECVLDGQGKRCIPYRMTKVLTVRLAENLLGKAEARAARLGLDRAKYIRMLIEEDLAGNPGEEIRKFASEDVVGMYETSGAPATNRVVREQMRKVRHDRGA